MDASLFFHPSLLIGFFPMNLKYPFQAGCLLGSLGRVFKISKMHLRVWWTKLEQPDKVGEGGRDFSPITDAVQTVKTPITRYDARIINI
jgi:hypothetical protein